MPTKIGHFEIQSELAKSPTGAVYKANDPQSGQTVALKAIRLSAFGDQASSLEQALLEEVERAKDLDSPNITPVLTASDIEGEFCATMEYVQGNSIATMLARKEGFSIWDLLDIGRQLCGGLDYAASKSIVHHSLEPSKIMCGWDGTVRILGFGVSSVGNFVQHVSEGVPTILHYMSPEQVRGESLDLRSNLFSLGAIFYEMVTERKPFEGGDIASLRHGILEKTPTPPLHVNPKVHPLLSDLILRTLAKDPGARYQSGRQLLDDLEKCKESRPAAKKAEPAKGTMAPRQAQTAAQSKFISSVSAQPPAPKVAHPPVAAPKSGLARPASTGAAQSGLARPSGLASPASRPADAKSALAKPSSSLPAPKAAAAAAGVGAHESRLPSPSASELDISADSSEAATIESSEPPSAYMSSAVADEPVVETFEPQADQDAPNIAVDPMMAEGHSSRRSGGPSFSEMTELPPLKEEYVAPPPPPPPSPEPAPAAAPKATVYQRTAAKHAEKPKVQPREVAQKAIKEIKGVPPKLMLYALGGAGALILAIGIGVTIYIHSQDSGDDNGASRPAPVTQATAQPSPSQPAATAPAAEPAPAPAAASAPEPTEITEPEPAAPEPSAPVKSRNSRRRAAAPLNIPGQLAIDSTPEGAQVQVDGRSEPNWVTPFTWTNLQPGKHSITVSKPGYAPDTRSVEITSGNRASALVHLAQLVATLVVKSNPPGANIYVDGRDVGARTPAQVSVDKGQHVVLVRMMGYIDETMNAQFVLGQTFNFSPTLRPLGSVDNIHTVGGRMSKLFGGKGVQAGQATLSIRTQPKGAQVAINQHIMDKNSPLDVALDPGNYVIDITLTGYEPVHKIVTVDKGGKVVVDEALQQQ